MQWKLSDAYFVVKEQKEANTQVWRENERILRDHHVSERFFTIWEEEKAYCKRKLEEKRARKVTFIIDKARKESSEKRKSRESCLRGIDVSDKHLDDRFESAPRVYGDVELLEKKVSVSNFRQNSLSTKCPVLKTVKLRLKRDLLS